MEQNFRFKKFWIPLFQKSKFRNTENSPKEEVRGLSFLPKELIQDIFCLHIATELDEKRTINKTRKMYQLGLFNLKYKQNLFNHKTL